MQLIDTHAHLDEQAFETDRDDVVARAAEAGIAMLITIGTTADSSQRAVELTRQYESLFQMEDCQLQFTEKALEAIARKAMKKATGARALRSIIEEVMLDIMYDLPENRGSGSFVLDEKIVEGAKKMFKSSGKKPWNNRRMTQECRLISF